jgi:hypothetical protein
MVWALLAGKPQAQRRAPLRIAPHRYASPRATSLRAAHPSLPVPIKTGLQLFLRVHEPGKGNTSAAHRSASHRYASLRPAHPSLPIHEQDRTTTIRS